MRVRSLSALHMSDIHYRLLILDDSKPTVAWLQTVGTCKSNRFLSGGFNVKHHTKYICILDAWCDSNFLNHAMNVQHGAGIELIYVTVFRDAHVLSPLQPVYYCPSTAMESDL